MNKIYKYELFPINHTNPQGWIREFLNRQSKGLTGHIDACGYPFNTKMWETHLIPQDDSHKHNPDWSSWWPFEQTSYYLDGANRVGIYTDNKSIKDLVEKNKKYIMKHISSNGRIGTNLKGQWWRWPYANIMRIFITDYMMNKNPDTLQMIINHYNTFQAEDFQDELDLANVEQLCWLYLQTKDQKYIEISEEAYRLFQSNYQNRNRADQDIIFGSDRIPDAHGVVYIELLKVPLLLYAMTGKESYYHDAINGVKKMEENFMLVSGIPSSTEHFHQVDERAGHETCNAATFPYTYGFYQRVLGDLSYADKIERAVFNGALGSISKDFSAHQYFSCPNQVVASETGNHLAYYPDFNSYFPGHTVECCTGNVNRFMPYYVEQMYLKTDDDGVLISLYGPSIFNLPNKETRITQETEYPFEDLIRIRVTSNSPKKFPIYLRIPSWSKNYKLTVNDLEINICEEDGLVKINQLWQNDYIELTFYPEIMKEENANGLSIVRGPLVYSLPINSKNNVHKNYKKSTDDFPAVERHPDSKWNYGLKRTLKLEDVTFNSKESQGYPWDIEHTPLSIDVPAYQIRNWEIDTHYDDFFNKELTVTPLFTSYASPSKIKEYLKLVPYGATLLRISIFPLLK